MTQEPTPWSHVVDQAATEADAVLPSGPSETHDLETEPTARPGGLRMQGLLWIFGLLVAVLVAPLLAERIQYSLTRGKERARAEIARENLKDLRLSQMSTAFRMLANTVGPSVVNIQTGRGMGRGEGSGVIVDEAGYIVTNAHVVGGVRTAEIQLSDGRRGPASVVGIDRLSDVAVLKTELEDLVAAKWGDSDALDVGEMVWAVGSPFALQNSITFGILSAKERRGITDALYQEFLQTDAAVNPGNSGGPLVNIDGEVVGINTAILGSSYQGISFSIPSALARDIYVQLRESGSVERGYLGVSPRHVSDEIARRLNLDRGQGVFIETVEPNTPADDAGMHIGDVILSWDGQELSDPTLLSRTIAATTIGSKVPVQIVRSTSSGPVHKTLTITVATKPLPDSL